MKDIEELCPRDQLLFTIKVLSANGQKFKTNVENQIQFCEELVSAKLLKKLDEDADTRSYALTKLGDGEIKFAFEEPVQKTEETEESESETDSKDE